MAVRKIALLILSLIIWAVKFVGFESASGESAELLVKLSEALEFRAQQLYSHELEGVYREIGGNGMELKVVKFYGIRSGDQAFVELENLKSRDSAQNHNKVRFVSDGDLIMITSFSPSIRPSGCETWVYEAEKPIRGGWLKLPFSPTDLADSIDLRKVLRNADLQLRELEDGRIEGTYDISPKAIMRFTADPDSGYGITSMTVTNKGQKADVNSNSTLVEWSKTLENFWFIKTLAKTKIREGVASGKQVWEISHADPNAVSDETSFSISRLDICNESRVVDKRPNAPNKIQFFKKATDQEDSIDGALGQLQSVESRNAEIIASRGQQLHSIPILRMLMIAINLAAVILLAAWVYWKRIRKSDSDI